MTRAKFATIVLFALGVPSHARSTNWSLPFQGIATDSTGRPRPDGTVAATFELFDAPAGGTSLWTETDQVVLKKGLFSVDLGLQNGLPLSEFGRRELWLAATLAGDASSPKRIALGRSAESWYASQAGYAGASGWSDTANHARTSRRSDSSDYATFADSARSSRRSDTAKYALAAPKQDTANYAAKSRKSDSASYASKAPFGLALKEPLILSTNSDTLKLKAGGGNNQFLTWDGSNWVAKSLQIGYAGSSTPVSIRNPYLGVNYIIAAEGIFPSRPGDSPFIGEIEMVGFDWAPRGWLRCDGQLLSIASNQALFALIGTYYGDKSFGRFSSKFVRSKFASPLSERS